MLSHSWLLSLGLSVALSLPARAADQVKEPPLTNKDRAHWSFKRPERPRPPEVHDRAWVRTPIDAFILARLQKESLRPSTEADPVTLLRRLTFDLTGLPPTPEEVDEYLRDRRPDAYERAVERLLASPHYGERWAQHWLDVVRYAESNGYEADGERPHAWRYRDYVVRSFNDDKPYDRFVTEQLAGDELARGKDARQCVELLIATGLNRCGPVHLVSGNTDPDINRQEVLTEMTTTVGAALLGLTVSCARCHDHKFDPFSQADYYRLQAFFAAAQPKEIDIATSAERAAHEKKTKELNERMAPLKKAITQLEAPYRAKLTEAKKAHLEPVYLEALAVEAKKRTPEQKKLAEHAQVLLKITWDELLDALSPEDSARRADLRGQLLALEAQLPSAPPHAWAISNGSATPATHLLKRGEPKNKGPVVSTEFPRVLRGGGAERNSLARSASEAAVAPTPDPRPPAPTLSRLAFAEWLTHPDHPLTARVLVNRLWQHHFGRGLVATPNDFGIRGEPPTHPELLDWLATEFAAHGWSVKHLHRVMVLSSAYRQASSKADSTTVSPRSAVRSPQSVDPDNRLLWRMNRRRLESEALRDSILAAAGTLNPKLGGPMVRVPLEPEVYELIFTEGEPDGLWHPTLDPREFVRRSLYLFAKRNVRLPLLETFDQPDTLNSCPVRPVSTFAPQALILLNGPFIQEQAKAFAARLLRECGPDVERQIDRAYRLALARPPRADEARAAREFLREQGDLLVERLRARRPVGLPPDAPDGVDPAAAAALVDFCLALLNRNEFAYVR